MGPRNESSNRNGFRKYSARESKSLVATAITICGDSSSMESRASPSGPTGETPVAPVIRESSFLKFKNHAHRWRDRQRPQRMHDLLPAWGYVDEIENPVVVIRQIDHFAVERHLPAAEGPVLVSTEVDSEIIGQPLHGQRFNAA